MNTKMTIVATFAAVLCAGACWARPHGGFHHGPPPVFHHGGYHHHHVHHGFGPGFVGGVVGGVVGGIIHDAIVGPSVVMSPAPVVVNPAPVVVAPAAPVVVAQPAPVYTMQNVWVEGRYVDQIQPNGATVRVWQPGHYEQRQVQVQ